MTLKVGSIVKVINAKNTPLRGQRVTIKQVGMIGTSIRYFCKAENGRDGWLLEGHIEREDERYEDRLMTMNELSEATDVSADILRNACSRKKLEHMREGNVCYSTVGAVNLYKLQYMGDHTRMYNKSKEEL